MTRGSPSEQVRPSGEAVGEGKRTFHEGRGLTGHTLLEGILQTPSRPRGTPRSEWGDLRWGALSPLLIQVGANEPRTWNIDTNVMSCLPAFCGG